MATILESLVYNVSVNAGNSVQVMGTLEGRMGRMLRLAQDLNNHFSNLGRNNNGLDNLSKDAKDLGDKTRDAVDQLKQLQQTVGKLQGNINVNVGVQGGGMAGGKMWSALNAPVMFPQPQPQAQPKGGTRTPKVVKSGFDVVKAFALFNAIQVGVTGIGRSFANLSKEATQAYDNMANMNARIDTFFGASAGLRDMLGAKRDTFYGDVKQYRDIMSESIHQLEAGNQQFLTTNTLKNIASAVSAVGVSMDTVTSKKFMEQMQDFSIAKYGAKSELSLNEQINLSSIFTRALAGRAGTLRSSGIMISDEQVKFLNRSTDIDKKVELLLEVISVNTKGLTQEMIKNNENMFRIQERRERRLEDIARYSKSIQDSTANFRDTVVMPIQGIMMRTLSNIIGGFKGLMMTPQQEEGMAMGAGILGGALAGAGIGKMLGVKGFLVGGLIGALVYPAMAFIEQVRVDMDRLSKGQVTFLSEGFLQSLIKIGELGGAIWESMKSIFNVGAEVLKLAWEIVEPIMPIFKIAFDGFISWIEELTLYFNTFADIIKGITGGLKNAKSWFSEKSNSEGGIWGGIKSAVGAVGEKVSSYMDNKTITINVDSQETAQGIYDIIKSEGEKEYLKWNKEHNRYGGYQY